MTTEDTNTGENTTPTEENSTSAQAATKAATKREPTSLGEALAALKQGAMRTDLPDFKPGDCIKVHAKIVEGNKERVQIFEGTVLKRSKGNHADASFTVRKVSYNIGVERTFPLHSPRIEKVELVSRSKVRRSRLFYLRPLRGKATRMKTLYETNESSEKSPNQAA
jgi:large subunit ribosomal protein L19